MLHLYFPFIIKLDRHLYIIRLISLKRTIYHFVRKIGLLCKIISIRYEPFRFLNRKNCTSDAVQTGKIGLIDYNAALVCFVLRI